jgi:hypothetical protein
MQKNNKIKTMLVGASESLESRTFATPKFPILTIRPVERNTFAHLVSIQVELISLRNRK